LEHQRRTDVVTHSFCVGSKRRSLASGVVGIQDFP
jgi:hypothetical protein